MSAVFTGEMERLLNAMMIAPISDMGWRLTKRFSVGEKLAQGNSDNELARLYNGRGDYVDIAHNGKVFFGTELGLDEFPLDGHALVQIGKTALLLEAEIRKQKGDEA